MAETFLGSTGQLAYPRAFLRRKGLNISRWTCSTIDHPKQADSISCGVFVCKFAECILKKEQLVFETSSNAINVFRREIAETSINESDDVGALCHVCAEKNSKHEKKMLLKNRLLVMFANLSSTWPVLINIKCQSMKSI
ncbi:uncharacterized protein LOC144820050 [Lissotriton helveticus]